MCAFKSYGLIYDAGPTDYISLLCGLNFTSKQIQTITRLTPFDCSNSTLDLNYSSFIVYFDANETSGAIKEFRRTVTNVGDGKSVYTAMLPTLDGLKVSASPEELEFSEQYEKKSYKVSVEGPRKMMKNVIDDECMNNQVFFN